MQYFAGPDLEVHNLRIGDIVTNEDKKPLDVAIVDNGYFTQSPFLPTEFHLVKQNAQGARDKRIVLSAEEITLMYEYMMKTKKG